MVLSAVLCSTPVRADLRDGLISYWPFDGNGADASSFGRDLTLQGGVGFAPGLFGQALDMHKSQATYAQRLVDDAAYDFGASNFTVQTWVNYYSSATEQVLIEKFTGNGGPGWTFTKPESNVFQFYADGPRNSPGQSISTTAWNHLIVRRSGSQLQIWRNGSLILTSSVSSTSNSATPLYIGRRNPGDTRDFSMNGRLDDVAIWNRALSDAEIAYLYNGGSGNPVVPVPEPNTILLAALGLAWAAALTCRTGARHRSCAAVDR